MSDWQVGDLALCVSNGPDPEDWQRDDGGPVVGSVNTVTAIARERHVWLSFEPWPVSSFRAIGFRKIRPLSDEEKRSFEAELRTSKPVKVGAQPVENEGAQGTNALSFAPADPSFHAVISSPEAQQHHVAR